MARIKKYGDTLLQNLASFNTFITDRNPNSDYFRITEFKEAFTGGKNGFLIEGSQYLLESTEIKIEIIDVDGNPIYWEPGDGIPEYYEGTSKVVAVYVYEDTPIGEANITVLGELKEYFDEDGIIREIPNEWKGIYNVKWEKSFKVNKLLPNVDKVRFYKRPKINIDEIARPIFTATPITIEQSGILSGTPLVPAENVKLSTFSLPSSYLLTIADNTNWSGSIIGGSVSVPNLGFTFTPSNVVTNKELIVSNPYTSNGLVSSFNAQPYTASFIYLVEDTAIGTALSGSFAKIKITDLTTFVGDVARVKVFRKSQSEVADFQFVQEIALESNEILIDLESSQRNQENYGLFTPSAISNYWLTSSNDLSVTFNQNFLYNSAKLDSVGSTEFFTSKSIEITEGVEYTLDMFARLEENLSSANYIKAYLKGTKDSKSVTQEIVTIASSATYLQKTNVNRNFIADSFDDVKLYFEVKGNGWYISDVSLRASQETSFSPDEITFIQPVPRTLETETFDFRFEFYDINNNYIPVLVETTKTFDGGNLNQINKSINLVPSSLYFQFDSGSGTGNPVVPTTIFIEAETNFLTGSLTFTSRSYDFFNNELSASQYGPGEQYPGLLDVIDENSYSLSVGNFTGSKDDIVVQYIEYTAAAEGVSDSIIIARVSDGKGGVNYEIRPYNGTVIRNSDASSSLEIQAIRIDGINELNLQSGLPLGKSDYKLFVQSGSTYITLEEASNTGYVLGLSAGVTGSGELNYNARFNRDSILKQRTVYLIPSSSNNYSASILTSLTLTDLQDGLDSGIVLFDADSFTIDPNPKLGSDTNRFTPTFSSATASFYKRGTAEAPISCSIEVYPSMSLNSDFVAEYWIQYVTHSCDPNISIVAYDEIGNIIPSRDDAATYQFGSSLQQNKQLLTSFLYTEPWSSASIAVDHLFKITPDGLQGADPITIIVEPTTVVLKSNENGDVSDFTPSATTIKVKQGNDFLIYDPTGVDGSVDKDGTFYITNPIGSNVTPGNYQPNLDTTQVDILPASTFDDVSGSVEYNIFYQPYYTSSIASGSFIQQFTKVSNGTAARSISISATANVVSYDGDGVVLSPEGDIVLNATAYNTTGSAFFQFFKNDIELTPPTSINFGGDTLVLSSGDAAAPGETAIFKVALRDGSGDVNQQIAAEDQVTITGIQSGGSPYAVSLTNENSSIFADVYDEITFSGTGTEVLATKGGIALTAVSAFSTPQFDQLGTVIPNGEYKVTLYSTSSHITPAGGLTLGSSLPVVANVATIGDLSAWNYLRDENTLQPLSSSAEIVYEIDLEDGKAVFYKTQSLSVQYEGNIGPGLIMRGEWTGSIDYIFDVAAKRRDAVFREISGDVHYWATTADLIKSVSPPYTTIPFYDGSQQSGDIDNNGWQYLGIEDFFVAAKLAIFEESFVKNVINVGNNGGAEAFANIVINGGRVDPYIAVGQTGTAGASGDQDSTGVIGYSRPGIFMGTKVISSTKTPVMSLVNTGATRYMRWTGSDLQIKGNITASAGDFEGYVTVAGGNMKFGAGVDGSNNGIYINANNYWYDSGNAFKVGNATNYLGWNGTQLIVRGTIQQTAAGDPVGEFRGAWAPSTAYYVDDTVTYSGASYICLTNHTSTNDTNINTGNPASATNAWTIFAASGTSGTSGTAGATGETGPGISYVGNCALLASGFTWVNDASSRMAVSGSGGYYLTKAAANGQTKATTGCPPNATYFEPMNNFASVATDILLAQDANIYRGLVIGESGGDNGFIRSSDATSLEGGNGFYLRQDGQFRFGAPTGSSNPYIYWNNNVLEVRGKILTDANEVSELGNWKVSDGNFLDSTERIILNATEKSLTIRDNSDIDRVIVKQGQISNPAAGSTSVAVNPPSTDTFSGTQFTAFTESIYLDTTGWSITEPGTYAVVSPNWGSTFSGIYFQANNTFSGYIEPALYVEIWDTPNKTGNYITQFFIGYATAGSLTGPLDETELVFYNAPNLSITFPTAGTYYAHTAFYIYGYASSGFAEAYGSMDPNSVNFSLQLEQVEIGQNGILVQADSNNYVKIERTSILPIIDIKTNAAAPGLRITNSNASGRAIEVLDGDIYLSGTGNNLRIAGGWIGTDNTAGGVRMGTDGTNSVLMGGNWPSQASNVANARLRPGNTKFGIAGRELIFDSSTIRVKTNIEDYPETAYQSIKNLKPVLYTPLKVINTTTYETVGEEDYQDSYPMPNAKEYIGKHGGFIAEWLDEDPEMRRYVTYGVSGSVVTPDSLTYDKIVVPLTKAVQILMDKVESLEAHISSSM